MKVRESVGGRVQAVLAMSVCVLFAGVLVGCGSSSGSSQAAVDSGAPSSVAATGASSDPLAPQPLPKQTTVTVAWPVAVEAFGSVIVGQALGEFQKENIKVKFVTTPASSAVALLETGRADVYVNAFNAAILNDLHKGGKLRWEAPNFFESKDSQSGLWLVSSMFNADGSVNASKLKGATLALGSPGASNAIAGPINDWLGKYGLNIHDIKISTLSAGDILIGMQSGAVQGGWLSDPIWIAARDEHVGKAALTQPTDLAFGGYFVSGSLLTDKKDIGKAFFRALARTNRDYLQGDYHNNKQVIDALAKATGVSADNIRKAPSLNFPTDLSAFDPNSVVSFQKAWLTAGNILDFNTPIPTSQIVDASLLPGK